VPWLSAWWAGRRRVVWLHHVHADMWKDALPRPLDVVGRTVETKIAPRWYRRAPVVTLSASSQHEIEAIGIPGSIIHVIPPGVNPTFVVDETKRSATPHVLTVGRLAPVKRMHEVLAAVENARGQVPGLTLEIVGDGPLRPTLEAWIRDHDASSWAILRGRVDDAELIDAYQRAWVVTSASSAEGWGMSLTEGATCGTPSVATDIPGHRDSVVDGGTGDLVRGPADLGPAIAALILDEPRRRRYSEAAVAHASAFSWDAVAARQLAVVVDVCRSASGA
jgi:glycosyltransferase involved in cell wall biosynthesis